MRRSTPLDVPDVAPTQRRLDGPALPSSAAAAPVTTQQARPVWNVVDVLLDVVDVERRRRTRGGTVGRAAAAAPVPARPRRSVVMLRAHDDAVAGRQSVAHHLDDARPRLRDQLSVGVPVTAAAAETGAAMKNDEEIDDGERHSQDVETDVRRRRRIDVARVRSVVDVAPWGVGGRRRAFAGDDKSADVDAMHCGSRVAGRRPTVAFGPRGVSTEAAAVELRRSERRGDELLQSRDTVEQRRAHNTQRRSILSDSKIIQVVVGLNGD